MRRLFIFQICCLIAFSPIQSFAVVSSAVRSTTALISNISSNGAVYGGASGSNLVVTATRSFAGGYAASPSGVIQAGAAGGYSAVETVALSRGATAGLLRLGLQAGKCLGYVGAVITAAQLAGLAWEWYQSPDGQKFFRRAVSGTPVPVEDGFYLYEKSFPPGIDPFYGYTSVKIYSNQSACYNAAVSFIRSTGNEVDFPYFFNAFGSANSTSGTSIDLSSMNSGHCGFYNAKGKFFGFVCTYDPNQPATYEKVPWDDVQKKIEDDLSRNPSQWADPFKEAVKEVPPAVNPWLDKSADESKSAPAPVPMPDSLPYPTPSGSPSAVNPATGAVEPLPLPNELTKEDIAKVASEVLSSLKPAQVNNIQTADVTAPSANQDLAQQLSAALSAQIPQPPYDVKVINEPTIKIKTEDSWKSDAESAVGTTTEPDSNDSLDINLDLEKYKSKKRDLSFLDTIYNNIKSLPLFQLFNKNPLAISAGSPELCLDIPQFGNHCVNLNTYTTVFETIGSVVLALTFFTCLAIIFL